MAMKIAIFEDDKDLADILKEYMDRAGFEVTNVYRLDAPDWDTFDVVIGDFRNVIVPFAELEQVCAQINMPLLAISGYETTHRPQLIKPFTLEQLQAAILEALRDSQGPRLQRPNKPRLSAISRLFRSGSRVS